MEPPASAKVFTRRSYVKTTAAALLAFHEQPDAFNRLTPPPILMQLHRDDRTAITAGEVEFTLWFGPIPVRWIAHHEPGPTETSFADRQIKGPMAYWRHEHVFEDVEGGATLTDQITLAHRPGWRGWLTRLAFDGLPLRFLFAYRHWRTRRAVES